MNTRTNHSFLLRFAFGLFFTVTFSGDLISQNGSTSALRPIIQAGPGGTIGYLEAFADGERLLSVDFDDTVGIWQVDGGWEVQKLTVGSQPARAAALSPDGRVVGTGGEDGRIIMWDTSTERVISTNYHPEKGDPGSLILKIIFSGDGHFFGSIGQGHYVKIWSALDGHLIRKIHLNSFHLSHLAFVPNSSVLLVDLGDGSLVGQDVVDGTERYRLEIGSSEIEDLKILDDTRLAVTSKDKQVSAWDLLRRERIWSAHGITSAENLSYDSKTRLLVTWSDTQIDVIDADSGLKVRTISNIGPISALCTSPQGGILFLGLDSRLAIFDINTGKFVRDFAATDIELSGLAFSPSTHLLAMGIGGGLGLWHWEFGLRDRIIPTTQSLTVRSFPDEDTVIGYSKNTVESVSLRGTGQEQIIWRTDARFTQIVVSSDGTRVVARQGKPPVLSPSSWTLWDTHANTALLSSKWRNETWPDLAFSEDRQFIATSSQTSPLHSTCFWRVDLATPLWCIKASQPSPLAISPDSALLAMTTKKDEVQLLDTNDGSLKSSYDWYPASTPFWSKSIFNPVNSMTFSDDGAYLAVAGLDGSVQIWKVKTPSEPMKLELHAKDVNEVYFSADDHSLFVTALDGIVELWDIHDWKHPNHLVSYMSFNDGSWATVTPDGYYRASPQALKSVAFRVGNRAYPFEQFDLRLNRPDIVLERLGVASKEVIAAYHSAYEERLRLYGLSEQLLKNELDMPTLEVMPRALPPSSSVRTIHLHVKAADPQVELKQLNVFINDVPIFGMRGIDLQSSHRKTLEQEVDVTLSAGANKVQISVLNINGIESLKFTSRVVYSEPSARKPDLYVLAVGVSNYKNADFKLDYAAKDATDLVEFWRSKRDHFRNVYSLPLIDADAHAERIVAAKRFLMKGDVDDEVIVFFAGHGLLDDRHRYYFATEDMDFAHPSRRGLLYEDIENLVDGIRARRKLVLIDTCQAGEVDNSQTGSLLPILANREGGTSGSSISPRGGADNGSENVKTRSFPNARAQMAGVTPIGLNNSISLLQELFADLRRGSGAEVIAASGGMEFALEGGSSANGTFTAAVLEGLKGEADLKHDGVITVYELREYVTQRVSKLTNGRQTPTARRENLETDFALF